jgi:hypothetical protein
MANRKQASLVLASKDTIMNLKPLLAQLRAVSDDELRRGLQQERLSITAEKYTTAFSCIAVAYNLRSFDFAVRTAPPDIPAESLRQNRQRASIVFLVFTTLQYMRSEHLERGLDHVSEGSPLRPFRDIFRAGCVKQGENTTLSLDAGIGDSCHNIVTLRSGDSPGRLVAAPRRITERQWHLATDASPEGVPHGVVGL